MTREHVFARWLVARVRGAKLMSSRAAAPDPRIARVIAPVCADRNAGWMSGLEVGADAQGLSLGSPEHRPAVVAGMPADIEVFVARPRRPRQAIDFVLVPGDADDVKAVAISVRDLG